MICCPLVPKSKIERAWVCPRVRDLNLCTSTTKGPSFIDLTAVRTNLVFCDQTAYFWCSIVPRFQPHLFLIRSNSSWSYFFVNCCDLIFHCLSCGFTRQLSSTWTAFEDRCCRLRWFQLTSPASTWLNSTSTFSLPTRATISSWKQSILLPSFMFL